jgi:hypothetical protein
MRLGTITVFFRPVRIGYILPGGGILGDPEVLFREDIFPFSWFGLEILESIKLRLIFMCSPESIKEILIERMDSVFDPKANF